MQQFESLTSIFSGRKPPWTRQLETHKSRREANKWNVWIERKATKGNARIETKAYGLNSHRLNAHIRPHSALRAGFIRYVRCRLLDLWYALPHRPVSRYMWKLDVDHKDLFQFFRNAKICSHANTNAMLLWRGTVPPVPFIFLEFRRSGLLRRRLFFWNFGDLGEMLFNKMLFNKIIINK